MKLLSLISLLTIGGTLTTYSQVYQRPTNSKVKPKVVKTVYVRMVGARTFHATAYSLPGRTATGRKVRSGIVAADPRVLKMGSKVRIGNLGVFVVDDTGGAIKGSRLDIWMPNKRDAKRFGRQTVQVTLIE